MRKYLQHIRLLILPLRVLSEPLLQILSSSKAPARPSLVISNSCVPSIFKDVPSFLLLEIWLRDLQ